MSTSLNYPTRTSKVGRNKLAQFRQSSVAVFPELRKLVPAYSFSHRPPAGFDIVFNLRLRQAETAFAEGRLNEAARLAEQPDVRDRREGQILITRIVEAFVARSREHLTANRVDEANTDCNEARQLAGEQPTVAELAAEIASAQRDCKRKANRKQQVAADAGQEIARGDLELGAKILSRLETDDSSGGSIAGRMNEQIAVSRDRIEAALERAHREVAAGHARESVVAILELQKLSPSHPELVSLIDQVTAPVVSQLWFEVEASRLDRVDSLIESVRPLVDFDPELTEVCHAVESAREIQSLLAAGRFDDAYLQLRKLGPLLGNVAWLNAIAEKARQTGELAVELQSGPLSLLAGSKRTLPAPGPRHRRVEPYPAGQSIENSRHTSATLPEQLVLQIDGMGSALLLRQPQVTLGAPARAKSVDVALTGFPEGAPLTLERSSGRWQLVRGDARDVAVNDQSCKEKVLADGDNVRAGKRCRFKFRRPTAAVPTAVLELTGTRLSRPDIRSVVLFDETLIVGPGQSSHLIARNLDQPLILFVRDGVFFVRSGMPDRAQRFSADGSPQGAQPLTLGSPVEIGGTRVTIFSGNV